MININNLLNDLNTTNDYEVSVSDGNKLVIVMHGAKEVKCLIPLDKIEECFNENDYDSTLQALRNAIDTLYLVSSRSLNYEEAKPYLIVRPLNVDENPNRLKAGVYRAIGDVALVLYDIISDNSNNLMTHLVLKSELEACGITDFDAVLDEAIKNTARKYPATILNQKTEEGIDILKESFRYDDVVNNIRLTMLSTDRGVNGAACIFYPGVREKLVEVIGDFNAIFMNTTDVLLYPDGTDMATMRRTLDVAQMKGPFGDHLSSMIFHCNSDGIQPMKI